MPAHTITFGGRFAHDEHPFFGNCPQLPEHYGIIMADDYRQARELAFTTFGSAWSMLYIGDAQHQENTRGDFLRHFPGGLMFILRADPAGQPVLTFPVPQDVTTTGGPDMQAAIYVGNDGYARLYEDQGTGPMDPQRAHGLTRVPLPETVERVQPRDIVAAERKHRQSGTPGAQNIIVGDYMAEHRPLLNDEDGQQ